MELLLSTSILLILVSFGSTSQPLSEPMSPYEYIIPSSSERSLNPEYRQLELNTNSGSDLMSSEDNISEKTEITLQQAIAIVEKRHLTECVARLICQLSCNPESMGNNGRNVYKILKKFESDTLPQLAFFRVASNRGKNLKPKCDGCYALYTNCKTPTDTLLRLASALSIKS